MRKYTSHKDIPFCHQYKLVCPATMKISKVAYTKSMLEIAKQGPNPVGSVEDWAISKRIARLHSTLKVMT